MLGLDPAGPGYDALNIGLNKTCAQFVQVLHTDAGDFGTVFQRGDVDFYANNRSEFQPGCTVKQCGHGKAVDYYYASLFPQLKFIGGDCRLLDVAYSAYTSLFGEFNDRKYGQFCFQTTPCFPYAQTIVNPCQQKYLLDEYKIHIQCKLKKAKKLKKSRKLKSKSKSTTKCHNSC